MSLRLSEQGSVCLKAKLHDHQKIQYICLQQSCLLNRLLCKICVHESHRKHKVGIIDKLIEPLNRLNMHSCYDSSPQDYKYLTDRFDSILDQWNKLSAIFQKYTEELQTGILFQLMTLMKTFTNEEIDHAYDVLLDGQTQPESVNQYVKMINFLNRDYLQDVDEVKKYADFISEKVKRAIGKTAKKVETMMKKMNDHFKMLDLNKFQQYKTDPEGQQDHSQNKDEKGDQPVQKQDEDTIKTNKQSAKVKKESEIFEEDASITRMTRPTTSAIFPNPSNTFTPRKPFQRYK